MLLLYYTSTVLFSLGTNKERFGQSTDVYDKKHLPQYVCVANCIQQIQQQPNYINGASSSVTPLYNDFAFLQGCVQNCKQKNTQSDNAMHVKRIQENYSLNLICRDDTTLNFRIIVERPTVVSSTETVHNPNSTKNVTNIFVIKINKYNNAGKYHIFVSDETFFTLRKLLPYTTYNITVLAVHANGEYSVIAKQQLFNTLRKGYTPNNIMDIKVLNFFHNNGSNQKYLSATISWKPGSDMPCFYDLICFSPESQDSELEPLEIRNPQLLFTYNLHNLLFSTLYKIGIRAKSTKSTRESELHWETFYTPSCVEWYNYNFNICAPLKPQGLRVEKIYIKQFVYALNISWNLPEYLPTNYSLWVKDLLWGTVVRKYKLQQDLINFFIPNITLMSNMYEINLIACSNGGKAVTIFTDFTKTIANDPSNRTKTIAVILSALFCAIILTLALVVLYYRQMKLKWKNRFKYAKECTQTYNVKPKSPSTPSAWDMYKEPNQSSSTNGKGYDDLEIDCNNLQLFEILGEGAFGLVKRGTYQDNKSGVKLEVAVKMLKVLPTPDEVLAFRQEIEVMKSLGTHPNILGIIGYSLRHQKHMMLLTEYCCCGNLLNYLREEWHYQQHTDSSYKIMRSNFCSKLPQIPELDESIDLKQDLNDSVKAIENQRNTYKTTFYCGFYSSIPKKDDFCNNSGPQIHLLDKVAYMEPFSANEIKELEWFNGTHNNVKKFFNKAVENKSYFRYQPGIETTKTYKLSDASKRQRLKLKDLLYIAKQIALGMEFLANHKIVHRDLAARNILVALNRIVKIADFGLSRDIYQESVYKKSGNGKLPIKWLALESLTHQVYTTQSDVWSYGILLYEIVTFGAVPYPMIPTHCLLSFLKAGYRMQKPRYCSQELYNLMCSCWNTAPQQRPTFSGIITELDKLLRHSKMHEKKPIMNM